MNTEQAKAVARSTIEELNEPELPLFDQMWDDYMSVWMKQLEMEADCGKTNELLDFGDKQSNGSFLRKVVIGERYPLSLGGAGDVSMISTLVIPLVVSVLSGLISLGIKELVEHIKNKREKLSDESVIRIARVIFEKFQNEENSKGSDS